MDLISRTTVAEEIEELIEIKRMDMGVYNAGFYDALGRVKLMIADQPTIDAVPVVHTK